jgi:hypothetical protein
MGIPASEALVVYFVGSAEHIAGWLNRDEFPFGFIVCNGLHEFSRRVYGILKLEL